MSLSRYTSVTSRRNPSLVEYCNLSTRPTLCLIAYILICSCVCVCIGKVNNVCLQAQPMKANPYSVYAEPRILFGGPYRLWNGLHQELRLFPIGVYIHL